MDKQNNKLIEDSSKYQPTDNKFFFRSGVIVFFIAITPLLFYSYLYFPEDSQELNLGMFSFKTEFENLNLYVWVLTGKIIPIYLLLMWFFTCKHWWHWIILVPTAMYSFQLWSILKGVDNVDERELLYIIPLMMIIVPLVYLIRAKLFNSIRGNDLQAFEKDLMVKKTVLQQLRELFR